ncbi:hypothetical protein TrVGV298_000829 [Trichoderma virens]|nr:hypothetical protein TrVGV298_000829 [Trichoderma virens]
MDTALENWTVLDLGRYLYDIGFPEICLLFVVVNMDSMSVGHDIFTAPKACTFQLAVAVVAEDDTSKHCSRGPAVGPIAWRIHVTAMVTVSASVPVWPILFTYLRRSLSLAGTQHTTISRCTTFGWQG